MLPYKRVEKKLGPNNRKELNAWSNLHKRSKRAMVRGRGSYAVTPRWRSFAEFFLDMGAAPAAASYLARHDTTQPWDKPNCYWAEHSAEFVEAQKPLNEASARKSQAVDSARQYRLQERVRRKSAVVRDAQLLECSHQETAC